MALHEVQLKGYSVRPGNLSLGTFDSYGIEQLHVTTDDSWDGLDILAVFHAPNGTAKKVVVGADGMLAVPPEATAKQAGVGRIVFVGLAENVQRITVDMGYNIKPHSDIEGDNPGTPTPDVVQQILANSNHAVSIATAAQEAAENARQAAEDAAKKAGEGAGGAAASAVAAKKSAEDAAASSESAAGKAEESASSASAAAENAKAAQAAQGSAENAAQTAADAAGVAGQAAGAAAQSAKAAETAKQRAEDAAKKALEAKTGSENALQDADAAKDAASGYADAAAKSATAAAASEKNAAKFANSAADSAAAAKKSADDANNTANSIKDSMTQISENKEAVSQLKEDTAALKKRQNVLVGSETGNPVSCSDAYSAPLCGLTVYGKSMQGNTTGAQLFDVSNADVVQMYIANSGIGNFVDNYSVIIPIKPSTSYTISEKNNKVFRVAITEEYPVEAALTLFKDTTTIYKNITTPNNLPNGNFLMIQLYGNFAHAPDFSGLMLNEGSTTKPWEPYTGGKPSPSPDYPQEIKSAGDSGSVAVTLSDGNGKTQTLTLPTPNSLPGIPVTSGGNYTDQNGQQWVCDEVDLERGVKVQRVTTIVFSDQKKFTLRTTSTSTKFRFSTAADGLKTANLTTADSSAFCSALVLGKQGSTWTTPNTFTIDADARLYVRFENINSLGELQQYLQRTPMSLTAILATPIETPLTSAEIAAYKALTAYAPDTVVQASDGAGVKLEYQRDVNIAIKNLEDAIASMTTT
jgi:hypothetical protein